MLPQGKDGKNGILVEPNDYKSLTEKVVFLLENPEIRKNMGHYGYWRAKTKFDWSVVGSQHENLLIVCCERVVETVRKRFCYSGTC